MFGISKTSEKNLIIYLYKPKIVPVFNDEMKTKIYTFIECLKMILKVECKLFSIFNLNILFKILRIVMLGLSLNILFSFCNKLASSIL